MKKNNKIFGLIACSAVLAGAVSLGAANVNVAPASAEETPVTFEVKKSAQVKYGEEGGIRFAATVSADYLATLGTTVKLVSSIDKAGNTDAGEAKTKEWIVKGEGSTYVAPYATNTYYHAIDFSEPELETVLKQAAAVELQATMWLESDGEKVAGSEQTVTRSMRAVANAVYDRVSADNQTELGKYFGERKTAKAAYKEVADDNAWVIDGGVVATAVYNGAAATGADLTVGETAEGSYALFDAEYNVYNVPSVTYVTKTLAESDDLSVLDLSTENLNGEKTLTGYYCLVKDITSTTPLTHAAYATRSGTKVTKNDDVGFSGTLEGNGHTISYTFKEFGLFGNILGENALIQNVNFVATRDTSIKAVNVIIGALAYDGFDGEIKNVYAKIIDDSNKTYRNASLIGARRNTVAELGITLTDLIVETTGTYMDTCRGGIIFDTDAARNNGKALKDRNVYVISASQYMAKWDTTTATKFCYANNDTYSGTNVVKYLYVNRYDNGVALYGAVTKVGNWAISADGSIAWEA